MVASPITATLGAGELGPKVMGVGLFVWMLAMFGTSFAPNYWMLLSARVLAGAGEAAFVNLAPPMIDDSAPKDKRSLYISVYFSAIFVGMAIGFVAQSPFHTWESGRRLFLVAGGLMCPLCLYVLCSPGSFPVPGAKDKDTLLDKETSDKKQGVGANFVALMKNPSFCLFVGGYAATIFTIGGFGFWAPTYCQDDMGIEKTTAGLVLGGITALSGLFGTAAGGIWLDKCCQSIEKIAGTVSPGDRAGQAARITWLCAAMAFPFCVGASLVSNEVGFFAVLGTAEFFLFMTTSPCNIGVMDVVPNELRGFALGMTTIGAHFFGDLLSPVIVGKIRTASDGSLRPGMFVLGGWIFWAICLWGAAYHRLKKDASAGSKV